MAFLELNVSCFSVILLGCLWESRGYLCFYAWGTVNRQTRRSNVWHI